MQPSYVWFSLAILLVIAELMTGTFYLLMIAVGLLAGGLAALMGVSFPVQTTLAALVAVVAIVLLRRSRFGKAKRHVAPARNRDVNLDIGEEVAVQHWDADRRARATYRGAEWDVELIGDQPALPGRYKIIELRGNTLLVASRRDHEHV
jgi:membrane protein implicated in regulation of membrane protease activity